MSQQPIQIDIPKEHLAMVLNASIAERMYNFERRVENGQHQWRGRLLDGSMSEWSGLLPGFADDIAEAMRLLQETCRQMSLGFNVIYNPIRDQHILVILDISPDGQKAQPKTQVSGRPLPELAAAAVCQIMNIDLLQTHRELYPGHYLLLKQ